MTRNLYLVPPWKWLPLPLSTGIPRDLSPLSLLNWSTSFGCAALM